MQRRSFPLRPVSLAAAMLAAASGSHALPQGAVPVYGQTTVATPAPGQMVIDQTSTRAGIDWTSFSIAAGERVLINQPGAGAVLVNRVTGSDPSRLFGQLQSNGSVWLINPRGIVFGASARVDVGSLVASTLTITQDDVASGRLVLGKGAGAGEIVNDGQITARNGTVVLAAPQVTHNGVISARRAGIAAATDVTVDVEGDGLIFFNARNDGTLDTRLSMLGNVLADGGTAELRAAARAGFADTVLNLEGVVQARSIGQRNGRIVIDGGEAGVTRVAGTLDAGGRADGETGGGVQVLGARVLLDASATVDASGQAGGGSIRVGGDFHGANPDLRNAERLIVRSGASLRADALARGDGGSIVLWSDQATRFHGSVSARGGAAGGDGGQVEISGKAGLEFDGSADLGAAAGTAGTLLLDPDTITFSTLGGQDPGALVTWDDTPSSLVVRLSQLTAALDSGSVELQATTAINLGAGQAISGANALTLRSGGNVTLGDNASITTGGLTIAANSTFTGPPAPPPAPTTGHLVMGANASLNVSGNLAITSDGNTTTPHSLQGTIAATGSVTISGAADLAGATRIDVGSTGTVERLSGAGRLTKGGAGELALGVSNTATGGMRIEAGTVSVASQGLLGAVPGATVADRIELAGGRLRATGNVTPDSRIGIRLDTGGGTIEVDNGQSFTYAGTIGEAGGVTGTLAKTGTGTLTLGTGSAYTGATTVSAGTLVLGGTLGSSSATVTVANGATLALDGAVTLANAVSLNGGTLSGSGGTFAGDITLGAAGTLHSASGVLTVSGDITGGFGITKTGLGTVAVAGANQYSGGTQVSAGTLRLDADQTVSSLAGSGTVDTNGHGLTVDGGGAGFAGVITGSGTLTKSGALTLTLSGNNDYSGGTTVSGGTLQLSGGGRAGAVGGALAVGSNAVLDLVAGASVDNAVQLAGGTLTSSSGGGSITGVVTLTTNGSVSSSAASSLQLAGGVAEASPGRTLTVGGTGTVTLAAASSHSGGTTIEAGATLATAGANLLADAGALDVRGTLALGGSDRVGSLTGTAAGVVTVTTGSTLDIASGSGTSTRFAGRIRGDGALLHSGTGRLTLAGNNDFAGGTQVSAGTLELTGSGVAGSGSIGVGSAGRLDLTGGATVANTIALQGTLGNGPDGSSGSGRASGVVTLSGSATLDSAGGGLALSQALAGSGAVTKTGTGTVTLDAGGTHAGGTTVSGGTLLSAGTLGAGDITVGNGARLALSAPLTLANTVALDGGTLSTAGGSTTLSGTLRLQAGGGTLDSAGTLAVDNRIAASGAGSLTKSGAGTVVLSQGSDHTGSTTVDAGTLRTAGAFGGTAGVTVASGATLDLVGGATLANPITLQGGRLGNSSGAGSVNGAITLGADSEVASDGTATGLSLAGAIGGSARLTKSGTGLVTLRADNGFGGGLTVAGGTLALDGSERLANTLAVTVNTGATLQLGGTETVGSLTTAGGTVGGSGTLNAGRYTLAGGGTAAGTALGSGTLEVSADSTLGGTAAAGIVNVNSARLTLGAAERLLDSATVNVANGRLTLAGDERIGSLNLGNTTQGGTLDGSGTLSATTYTLHDASVNTALGAGTINASGTSLLHAAAAAQTLNVSVDGGGTGRLTVDVANALAPSASVTVNTGATLAVTAANPFAVLALDGGSAEGTLASTALTSQGTSRLVGTSGATTVTVTAGVLTLAGAERLADSAAVTVAAPATLRLAGDETVGSLTLRGTLEGSGGTRTLGAGGGYTLQGGTVAASAALGAGTLTSTGNSRLDGTAAATTVHVDSDTLTLGGANRLADGANVTVATDSTLQLGGNDTVGSLTLHGTLAGSGTLTAATYTLADGTVNAALGGGTLDASGRSTLAAASGATTVNVNGGTLRVTGNDRLADGATVNVLPTATLQVDGTDTVATLNLRARLSGAGTLSATLATLSDATVSGGLAAQQVNAGGASSVDGRLSTPSLRLTDGRLVFGSTASLGGTPAVTLDSGSTLELQGEQPLGALSGTGTLQLNSDTTFVVGAATDARFDGVIAGSGDLIKRGAGSLTLGGANSYTGDTRVEGGTLVLGAAERIGNSSAVIVASQGVLRLNGTETVGSLTLAGQLEGSGTLVAPTYTLQGGRTLAGADLGAGTLSVGGGLASTLGGRAAALDVTVGDGSPGATTSLALGSAERLADGATLTVSGNATLLLSGAETVSAATIRGQLAGSGTLQAASYTLANGQTASGAALGTGSLRSSGSSTLGGGAAVGALTVDDGTLTLAGTLSAAPTLTLAGGNARLQADQQLSALQGSGQADLGGHRLALAVAAPARFDGTLAGSGEFVKQGTATLTLDGNSGFTGSTTVEAGTLQLGGTLASGSVAVTGGTLSLLAAERLADGADVRVAAGATLTLPAAERVGTLQLAGTLDGTGVLSAGTTTLAGATVNAALGGGTLLVTTGGTLNGTAASDTVTVNGGTLTLGSAGRLSARPAVGVGTGAVLALGGAEHIDTLTGEGRVDLGNALLTAGAANGSAAFDGVLAGSGGLAKAGTGTLTLNGASTYTGGTTVLAGTLRTGGAERLADGGHVSVGSDGRFELGGHETLAGLTLAGTLQGSGTLSAPTYELAGGRVLAALGRGDLVVSAGGTLAASADVDTLTLGGGTLTVTGGARLARAPLTTVAAGATLTVAGAETLGTLSGAGGVVLDGATLAVGGGGDAGFAGVLSGSGRLLKQGGSTFTLSGASTHTGGTEVADGTLALAGAERLADTGAVTVRTPGTLSLAGDQRVASLQLEGTLAGSGTLTAATYTLAGGTALADLGGGQLTSTGSSRIAGRAGAGTVAVNGGSLTLTGDERLDDTASVSVADSATLRLDGSERVASLALRGTLAGSGTLSAADVALAGGTVDANLGGGRLVSTGDSRLNGQAGADALQVAGGTLTLGSAGRLARRATATTVEGGAALVLGGDEAVGALAGAGRVDLGAATLTAGTASDSRFGGAVTGTGGLVKQGSGTLTLTGANTYTGTTRVDAGTLALGDGGSLQTSAFDLTGTLRFERSDAVTLATAVGGSGGLEQAGTGTLTLAGHNKTYSGETVVRSGRLATADAENLPDASRVRVLAGAALELGGAETLGALDAAGTVTLGGDLSAAGALRFDAAALVGANAPVSIRLSGTDITATNDGNRWGTQLALDARGAITLSSGADTAGGPLRDLQLGVVNAAGGGRIDAGRLTLAGAMTVSGDAKTLTLASDTAYQSVATVDGPTGKQTPGGAAIRFAGDVITQNAGAPITVASGATLSVLAPGYGSVQLGDTGNVFDGGLEVISGGVFSPWRVGTAVPPQARVRIEGTTVHVGGRGIEADVVEIRADSLRTEPGAVIAARLPFDNSTGRRDSVPGLTLALTPAAFALAFPFGGAGSEIAIDVGSVGWGQRSGFGLDAGYISVLPRNGAQGSTAVVLTGPRVGGYAFFFEGAGRSTEIPVFYNGVLPNTPQFEGSISATLAVSENARRQGFEEAVRTENVATRLRSGVIAEVGPGRPATVGTEGVKLPTVCPPAGLTLACGAE